MEIIIILIVVFIIIIFYKFIKFSNFKSQLMHAMAQEGISYKKANDLYTVHAKFVAKLHGDGLSPHDIAKGLASVANELSD